MTTVEDMVAELRSLARPDQLAGMARYGINTENALGIRIPELRRMAKAIGRDHGLALELWRTGIHDARILAGMIDDPRAVTREQMDDTKGR